MFCDYRIHPYINCILFVSISFTVTSTKLWKSNYSSYQEGLYKKICDLKKECDVMASADYKVISSLLMPDYADYNKVMR